MPFVVFMASPLPNECAGEAAFVLNAPAPFPWCTYARDCPTVARAALLRRPCRPTPHVRRELKRLRHERLDKGCTCGDWLHFLGTGTLSGRRIHASSSCPAGQNKVWP